MTYQLGSKILASDFNTFLGVNGTSAYLDEVTTVDAVGALYGVGYGRWGYGQTGITQSTLSVGGQVTSAQWLNLRNMLSTVRHHQTGSADPSGTIPPTTEFDVGDSIQAHATAAPTLDPDDFASNISAANTSRFSALAGSFQTGSLVTSTRAVAWTGSIFTEITVAFTDGDQIRYFFNQGNQITIDLAQSTATSPGDYWQAFFDATTGVGQIRIGANAGASGKSGIFGTNNRGYWAMSAANSQANRLALFTATDFDGPGTPYDTGDILVEGYYTGTNTHGSFGTNLVLRITLTHNDTGGTGSTVPADTSVTVGYRRRDFLSQLYAPSGATVTTAF